jgi:hypothetical protein
MIIVILMLLVLLGSRGEVYISAGPDLALWGPWAASVWGPPLLGSHYVHRMFLPNHSMGPHSEGPPLKVTPIQGDPHPRGLPLRGPHSKEPPLHGPHSRRPPLKRSPTQGAPVKAQLRGLPLKVAPT